MPTKEYLDLIAQPLDLIKELGDIQNRMEKYYRNLQAE